MNHPFNRIGKSAFVLILTIASAAQAAILADGSPGAAAPPATLGPYDMTAFGPDSQPFVTEVDGVAGPKGGDIVDRNSLFQRRGRAPDKSAEKH